MIELLYERRTLENPSTPLSKPDDWLYDAMGAGSSSSGVRVSTSKALTHDAYWRAIQLVSASVAKLQCYTYRRIRGGKERDETHPAFNLLRWKPNSEMVAFTFFQTGMNHVLSHGNFYSYIFRRGDGTPLELLILDPQVTYPVRENGQLLYVTKVGEEWRKLLPENVLHIKGLGYDGLCGYSVVAKAADSLGLAIGGREYQARYLRNNARPSAIIQVPGAMKIDAQKELLREWNEMHQGLDNAHRTAILTNGATLNAYSINARDSQLIETRKLSVLEISNWTGVPPHKLGDSSRTSYNSLEQENQALLDDTLDPWLVAIEQECRDKLLTEREKEKDSHVIEFMRQALVRANLSERYNAYNIAINAGIMSIDEVRGLENLNPLPDGLGQQHRAPLNMGVLESGDDKPEDPALLPKVADLSAIVKDVSAGKLSPDAAKIMLAEAFPEMEQTDIDKLIDAAEAFEPTPEPAVVSPIGESQPAADDHPPPEEPPADMPMDRSALVSAVRPIVEGAIGRVAKRMSKQIIPAASKPAKFLSVVDTAVLEFYDAISDEASRHAALCQAAGAPACDVRQSVSDQLGKLQEDLRALFAKCEGDALPSAVESRLVDCELSMSQLIAGQLLGKTMP